MRDTEFAARGRRTPTVRQPKLKRIPRPRVSQRHNFLFDKPLNCNKLPLVSENWMILQTLGCQKCQIRYDTSDMANAMPTTDREVIDVLRRSGAVSVHRLVEELKVTATAVRQRLSRLMAGGMVARKLVREGRGRPAHHYELTDKGVAAAGTNHDDLVTALWDELRAIKDPAVRSGLLQRIAQRLAAQGGELPGGTLAEKMDQIVAVMGDRDVPFEVDRSGELPVLTALACPYPDLAERDRAICSVEKIMFSEMLGQRVRLTECRLDGGSCCAFEPTGSTEAVAATGPSAPVE